MEIRRFFSIYFTSTTNSPWSFQLCMQNGQLTCFLTPGNMTTNAKNNVANKTQTATMDTSYVTDVRFDTVYNVGPSLL